MKENKGQPQICFEIRCLAGQDFINGIAEKLTDIMRDAFLEYHLEMVLSLFSATAFNFNRELLAFMTALRQLLSLPGVRQGKYRFQLVNNFDKTYLYSRFLTLCDSLTELLHFTSIPVQFVFVHQNKLKDETLVSYSRNDFETQMRKVFQSREALYEPNELDFYLLILPSSVVFN